MTDAQAGLWLAFALDGQGGAREIGWEGAEAWRPEDGPVWVHLDPTVGKAAAYLQERSGIPESERAALLEDVRRPRFEPMAGNRFVITLRGLSAHTSANAGDPNRIALWIEPRRMISVSSHDLPGIAWAREHYPRGEAPRDIPSLLLRLAAWLCRELHTAAVDLEDPMAELEYLAEGEQQMPSPEIRRLEREITLLRRHLAPLKILLGRIRGMSDSWLIRDHVTEWQRLVDDAQDADHELDALHTRAHAMRDFVGERHAERTNYILYILTILSAVMLPLTLITGLFGMNIGVPQGSYWGMQSGIAFVAVCVVLVAIAAFEYRLIKRRRLL